jgi:type I pullulanase
MASGKSKARLFVSFVSALVMAGAYLAVPSATTAQASVSGDHTVVFHYKRTDNSYTGWNMWVWLPDCTTTACTLAHGVPGSTVAGAVETARNLFNGQDSYGKTLTLNLHNIEDIKKIGFIVRQDDWTKDVGADRFVTSFSDSGTTHVYLASGIGKVYNTIPCFCAEVLGATLDDYRKINVTLSEQFNGPAAQQATGNQGWTVSDGTNSIEVTSVTNATRLKTLKTTKVVTLNLASDLSLDANYTVSNTRTSDVTNASLTSNVATLTTAAADTMSVGQRVIISGVGAPFDGVQKVKAFNATTHTFTIAITNANISSAAVSGSIETGFGSSPVVVGTIYSSQQFSDQYTYTGNDLGATYTSASTALRVWAPTASAVSVMTYGNAITDAANIVTGDANGTETPMTQSVNGTWVATLSGNQHGTVYMYKVTVGGLTNYAIDPYARSAVPNGHRGVIVDLALTNPTVWNNTKPAYSGKAVDATVYELHVRDFSVDASSNIPTAHRGKFLAFTHLNTKYSKTVNRVTTSTNTGLSAIKQLGVSHVELLPVYDFNSVDETGNLATQFNWGYDPQNFNVPEGSYSTNPADPIARIKELKIAVQAMHTNGLRVVMDVVYPHVASATGYSQQLIVPGYFYRTESDGTLANGTGMGNEMATERPMVRKFIQDSVKYWESEYHMDGFRFDQMGIIDVTTMQGIRSALDSKSLLLGEGWNMGNTLPADQRAMQDNLSRMVGIGAFNDQFRDGIKGGWNSALEKGWATGLTYSKNNVQAGITGNVNYSSSIYPNYTTADPGQSVNYVESHDNWTLYDKVHASYTGRASTAEMTRLSGSIPILAQGMPFQQAGQEFLRTKNGDGNSYNAPDAINSLKYATRLTNATTVNYYAGLYAIRKAHPAFRMDTTNKVKANLKFLSTPDDMIGYTLNGAAVGDTWKQIVVVHNSSGSNRTVALPTKSTWKAYVYLSTARTTPIKTFTNVKSVVVPASSTIVIAR